MKYTTVEAINRRLNGRLQIGGNANSVGTTTVTVDLVLQVGDQIESEIDAILRQRYRLPLLYTHPVLASVVEHGVACQLLSHYQVGATNDDEKSIPACYEFKRLRKELLNLSLAGEVWVGDPREPLNRSGAFAGTLGTPSKTVTW
jgi:hypothetical protein